jgi:hypothetical protein
LNLNRLQTFRQLKLQLVKNTLLFFIEFGDASQPDPAPFDRWQRQPPGSNPGAPPFNPSNIWM